MEETTPPEPMQAALQRYNRMNDRPVNMGWNDNIHAWFNSRRGKIVVEEAIKDFCIKVPNAPRR